MDCVRKERWYVMDVLETLHRHAFPDQKREIKSLPEYSTYRILNIY